MMLTRRIAEVARDLAWDHGIHPRDSVHVASAIAAKITVLNTFDKKLIGNPAITIEEPTIKEPELDFEG